MLRKIAIIADISYILHRSLQPSCVTRKSHINQDDKKDMSFPSVESLKYDMNHI